MLDAKEVIGECWLRQHYPNGPLEPSVLYINRADPVIWVAEEIIDSISRGAAHHDVSYGDGILTIRASNGTVSYGLGPHDSARLWRKGIRSDQPSDPN